ncbi:MAG: hypothetical protein KA313_10970 [Pseudarcicella sp.]|nr:hypothetical protein [Pseudarcicella sp.]
MMKVKTTILIIFALMGVFDTFCQNHKYLFLLKDKQNSLFTSQKPLEFLSPRAVERRKKQRIKITEQDFPVNPNYIKDIQNQGATIWYSSRWINGVMAECDSATAQKIISLPFVKGIELNTYLESPKDKGIVSDTPPIAISFLQFPSTPNADTIKYGDSKN